MCKTVVNVWATILQGSTDRDEYKSPSTGETTRSKCKSENNDLILLLNLALDFIGLLYLKVCAPV